MNSRSRTPKTSISLLSLILLLSSGVLACALSGESRELQATADAIGQAVSNSATIESAFEDLPVATVPSGDEPGLEDVVATSNAVFAAATQQALDFQTAQEAAATAEVNAATATVQARLPVEVELPIYGINPEEGRIGWLHPQLTLQTEGYLQYTYGGEYLTTVGRNFVLAADVTWNTRFGSTACGFVLRSDGQEEAFNQYLLLATRFTPGHIEFLIMQDGEIKDNEITDIVPGRFDDQFQWQNNTTNRLAVVARDDTFVLFTNGVEIGQVTPSVKFDRGFMAFVALNESGDTTCAYDNAWLWLLE